MTSSVLVMIQDGLNDYSIDIPLLTMFSICAPCYSVEECLNSVVFVE